MGSRLGLGWQVGVGLMMAVTAQEGRIVQSELQVRRAAGAVVQRRGGEKFAAVDVDDVSGRGGRSI